MNSCDFKEIIIPKDLEIENGILGLERDVYLKFVKFLDSSILRNICVNIFIYFNFLFVFFVVHRY
jgi:hypothetical protein